MPPLPPPTYRSPNLRRIILTTSIAAIAATGAWYGAGLKMGRERKKEVEAVKKATPAERIAMLETARGELVAKKLGLERKIEELQRRRGGDE
ncbi:hypothetical protein MMC30_004389 [Trapelia coarctata]|nr:hypothetical protein [Trapelia coarctata]